MSGRLEIEFRDHTVSLGPGELVVVPRDVDHEYTIEPEALEKI